jgi:hypothetical protein
VIDKKKIAPTPNVKDMQHAVNRRTTGLSHQLACPNRNVPRWFEADVLSVTKSNYWHEYEIKLSRSDFTRDFRNKPEKHHALDFEQQGKHIIRPTWKKPYCVPNYFWFVAPTGLLKAEDMPAYAGLLEIWHADVWPDKVATQLYWRNRVVKKAPRIHKAKLDDGMALECVKSMAYRFWSHY